MAPGSVPAGVPAVQCGGAGPATAVLTEFLGRRAFVPVAAAARPVPVLFSTSASVHSGKVVVAFCLITGILLIIFRHVFTNRTMIVR